MEFPNVCVVECPHVAKESKTKLVPAPPVACGFALIFIKRNLSFCLSLASRSLYFILCLNSFKINAEGSESWPVHSQRDRLDRYIITFSRNEPGRKCTCTQNLSIDFIWIFDCGNERRILFMLTINRARLAADWPIKAVLQSHIMANCNCWARLLACKDVVKQAKHALPAHLCCVACMYVVRSRLAEEGILQVFGDPSC